MLEQNLDNTIEKPIYYAEKEALAVIYAVKKFKHHLLGNSFVFYVDHETSFYLVNKPVVTS